MVMEEKINIAEILKDKPEDTELWTDMFGSVTLYVVTDACDAFQVKHHNKEPWFDKDGKFCKEGVLCIYPSKSMRDWHKFAWKKGDVLVSNDGKREVLFKTWVNDSYTKFVGLHCLINNDNEEVEYDNGTTVFNTNDFKGVEEEDVAQTYINTIEERLGGKLNRETLEVEKPKKKPKKKPVFELGNLYVFNEEDEDGELTIIGKLIGKNEIEDTLTFGNQYEIGNEKFVADQAFDLRISIHEELREATEGEAITFHEAYTIWEKSKKQSAFKPFDKVLVRDSESDKWRANLFGYIDNGEYYHCVFANWVYCIPYNEETAHLLGTTDEWKGGEG